MANILGTGRVIETRHDLVSVKFGAVHHSFHPSELGLASGSDIGIGAPVNIMDDGSYQVSDRAPTAHFEKPVEPLPSVYDLGEDA